MPRPDANSNREASSANAAVVVVGLWLDNTEAPSANAAVVVVGLWLDSEGPKTLPPRPA